MLQVQGLSKKYGAIVVADAVEFTLEKGHCLGVIGPNGAGKSSLFNLITGVAKADAGSVRLDGAELLGLPPHRRARLGVARAFQIPQAFGNLTVYENVLAAASFGAGLPGSRAAERAQQSLRRCGLAARSRDLAGRLPLLDRKRLELAKALATDPKLLLLDEVAGGLTEPEVAALAALVGELKAEYAVIWIEHIPQALHAVADRILVLHFGRKLLEAPPAEAMASREVREVYMGLADSP
ncbi:MAG TPA: ABC transporter ATP-binding protein [Rubrivivax sp.]|nr:ABC transporter ATP-binding protein [Burkholderiales bacterium]HNU11511.1 ABC transporter ATP-binding protein [Rubrivivax sp.]